jgi:cytochrome c553
MNRLTWAVGLAAFATGSGTPALAQVSAGSADSRSGQDVAVRICTACHVVSQDQPNPTILQPAAPSFRSIANRPGMTAVTVRHFIITTHTTLSLPRNMPNPQLSEDQATAVAAYLVSQRKQP